MESLSIYPSESISVHACRDLGTGYYDESESSGHQGPRAW
jgi:hypothetical protein